MTCHDLIKIFESCAITTLTHQDVDYDGLSKGPSVTLSYIVQDEAINRSCGNRIVYGDESRSLVLLDPSARSEAMLRSISNKFNMSLCQLQLSNQLHGPP